MSHAKLKNLTLASAVAMTLAIPMQSSAAVDMFIQIDGIAGESMDEKYKDSIDVLAWSWGMSTNGKGKTCVQDISLTKWTDSATPDLAQSIPDNTAFQNARLVVRKAGKTPLEYLVYDMSLVRVTSISSGGSGGEERLTENVTLNFEELTGTYTRQKEDGSADDPQEFFIPGSGCK